MCIFTFYNFKQKNIASMKIRLISENERGYFKAEEDGVEIGRMSYTVDNPTKITIDHTEVNADYEGQGIGRSLVMGAVEYARKNNIKILPLCTYARSVFRKTPEISDVLIG